MKHYTTILSILLVYGLAVSGSALYGQSNIIYPTSGTNNLTINVGDTDNYSNLATVPTASVAPVCEITSFTVSEEPACGDGFFSDDSYFSTTFTVSGGSGNYVLLNPDNNISYGSTLGAATDGMVTATGQASAAAPEGTTAQVIVRDMNNDCTAGPLTITLPPCPNCPGVGDLVITEIMQNPMAVLDTAGEYIEVYNASLVEINMKDMVISDDDGESHTITSDILVAPGSYVVLARNEDMNINGGYSADYDYSDFQLANTSDEIILTCQGTVIDRVAYDNGATFPDPNGASMQLDPGSIDAIANDDGANWCTSTALYGVGDLGTPGNANTSCCMVAISNIGNTPVSCQGGTDGTLTIDASGATSLNYSIDGPGGIQSNTSGVFTGLMAGSYNITVSDQNNPSCSATSSASVSTVLDNTAPTAICPMDITKGNDPGVCGAVVDFDIDVSDNCPDATVSADPASGSYFPVGTTEVVVTATDAAGNMNQCSFEVTVNDVEDPTIVCVSEIFVNNDPETCSATIDLPAPAPTDNCGLVSFEFRYIEVDENNVEVGDFTNFEEVTAGAMVTLPVGRYQFRFRTADEAGNSVGCNQLVTVTDNEDPVITQCDGATVLFNGEESFNSEDVIGFAATDNCGISSITYDPAVISCEDLGSSVPVTVTVTDVNGNPNSCTAEVVVDGLPCGFMLSELGCDGDADYDVPTETFTLESENCIYTNPFNQDQITFVATELCGDGEIIAQVSNINTYGWAGITMRETLDTGSKKVALSRDNGYFARREIRTATNGLAYPQQLQAFGKNWLRLVRQGNLFIGYVSNDGISWNIVMVANVSMSECIYAGLFLTNMQANQQVTADFNNVEVDQAGSGVSLQQLPGGTLSSPIADVSVYPNPTADLVTVNLGAMLDKTMQLELRNINGQILRQLDFNRLADRRVELQLGDLPAGIYWLRVQPEGEAPISKRIVVQRP